MDSLNNNSDAIIAIAAALQVIITGALVAITFYYAKVTKKILEENRQMRIDAQQMRIDAQKPDISIRLLSFTNEQGHLVAQLCVENIGSGPARSVQFHDVPPIQIQLAFIKDFPLIRYGISYLVPGEKKTIDLGSESQLNLNELEHKITVTYQDSRKKEYKKCFPLDFRSLWGENVPLVC